MVAAVGLAVRGGARRRPAGRPDGQGQGRRDQSGAKEKVEKEVNAKLLAEGRKNQCSFKTDSDQLMPGCDAKLKKLADALVDAKKRLQMAGVKSYKFEVSGHTDSSGKADHNKELSGKRAAVMVKELVARGISPERDHLGRHGLRHARWSRPTTRRPRRPRTAATRSRSGCSRPAADVRASAWPTCSAPSTATTSTAHCSLASRSRAEVRGGERHDR